MKKTTVALFLSTSVLLSTTSVALANDSTTVSQETYKVENQGTNLVNSNDFKGSFLPNSPVNSGIGIMATDGTNMSYDFSNVTNEIRSSSPLPAHRYGTISMRIVQDTSLNNYPADMSYRFSSTDGSLRSNSIRVQGNKNGEIITFTNVPKPQNGKPIYLFIYNNRTDKLITSGNGVTL